MGSIWKNCNLILVRINKQKNQKCLHKNILVLIFFNESFALLMVLRNERSHNVIMSRIEKLITESFPYMNAPYAFHLIAGQAKLSFD